MKISVLTSGRILLDGREVNLSELEEALHQAKLNGAAVQYTRENPESEAPPEADAVMKLIAANRLRMALAEAPRAEGGEVDREAVEREPAEPIEFPGVDVFFAKVRRRAAAGRGVSVVRQRRHYILPSPAEGSLNPQMIEGVKAMVPSDQPRNIAAVAAVDALAGDPGKPPTLHEIARHVPFFGLLMGLGYVGHVVWVFEASPATLTAGCEEADVLIVDSNAIAALPAAWPEDLGRVMRNANILIYDRSRQMVGAIRTAGEVPGKIEFPN